MSWYEELDRWTADYLPDMIYEHDAALAKYTSFRIGGPARRMAFPKDGSQMVLLIEAARGCGARPLVIGNGTNLLFPDEGVDRLVVNTRDMSCVVPGGGVRPEAGTDGAGICPRHPGQRGRRGVYERRGLRRGDAAGGTQRHGTVSR